MATDSSPETLTFVFTDLESSTRLWGEFPDAMKVPWRRPRRSQTTRRRRAKYHRYAETIVSTIVSSEARAATLRLVPR